LRFREEKEAIDFFHGEEHKDFLQNSIWFI